MVKRYPIFKRVGNPVEIRGLSASYLKYVMIHCFAIFLLTCFLFMAGMDPLFVLISLFGSIFLALYILYYVSKKYGEHGLMKKRAKARMPKYILSNKTLFSCMESIFKKSNHDKKT
ncbi:DUF4133 domain-containing protein [Myroides sp. LJL115]